MMNKKIIDLIKSLKFTTLKWCVLNQHSKGAYMLGFLDCKRKILDILEKENENSN